MSLTVLDQYKLFKILNCNQKDRLIDVAKKAETFYSRANWPGWIDHSTLHIGNVLDNLNKMIPDEVIKVISEEEAFVLLSSAILHDIGMCPEDRNYYNNEDDYFNDLRMRHGSESAAIIRRYFFQSFDNLDLLDMICEIVRVHHSEFNPETIGGDFDYISDALFVRLADGLDFGPKRAPSFLFDRIKPNEESRKYWEEHFRLKNPIIDANLFRIQVRGKVKDDDLVITLNNDFDKNQTIQENFLGRGYNDKIRRSYIIWDCTTRIHKTGEDTIRVSRPTIFSKENFLMAGRYLYNIAQYEAAKDAFSSGLEKFSYQWSTAPCSYYFYHFLQTHNKLGQFHQAIEIANRQLIDKFSLADQAAIFISTGISNLNLGNLDEALSLFRNARNKYKISDENANLINLADSWVLTAFVQLELLRKKYRENQSLSLNQIAQSMQKAEEYYLKFKDIQPSEPEAHYMGRFYGMLAYFELLKIDLKKEKAQKDWDNPICNAQKSYGGVSEDNRVPFGIMSGKYCEAAVLYHKYNHFREEKKILKSCVSSIIKVLLAYKIIYGNCEKKIYRTWDKIFCLTNMISKELEENNLCKLQEKIETILVKIKKDKKKIDKMIEIYSPLN